MTSTQHAAPWDAVVIGSGLGGLSCAAYLCAAGKRTLVLEAHYVAGGNSQVFRRDRHGKHYEFDVGIHYIFQEITGTFRQLSSSDRPSAEVLANAPAFLAWGMRPVTDLFREGGLSERAQAVLLGEQGDYAVPPSRTKAAVERIRVEKGRVAGVTLASGEQIDASVAGLAGPPSIEYISVI